LIQRFFGVHERLGVWRILGLALGFVGAALRTQERQGLSALPRLLTARKHERDEEYCRGDDYE
jgi:drug/metabolite transporter (DMT)-like permease